MSIKILAVNHLPLFSSTLRAGVGMELKSTKAQLAQYFSAWIQWWIDKNRYTQLQAAVRLTVTPGFVNMIINNKRAASVSQMEKIAQALEMDILDILLKGRHLLTGKLWPASGSVAGSAEAMDAGLSPRQTESLRQYRDLLLLGGEGVELISGAVESLALKKTQGGSELKRAGRRGRGD